MPMMLVSLISHAQNLEVTITDQEGMPLENAVIELLLDEGERTSYMQPTNSSIDQLDKEFVPTVTVISAGSDVSFPNSDDILHHVYSFSQPKTFNIPLYGRGENDDYHENFPSAGVVEIGCNIHDWMLAYIYVAESELASLSDTEGVAILSSTLSGDYQLRVWHPQASEEELVYPVSLSPDQTTTLAISLELQRDRRVRRAPGSSGRRYR
ncbi:MAG: methylamine utilization protein [Proteobacteria bacterium]|jgi:plastocyanin|nr:methylamine utilization protein [Pseudomonadota bacterium]